MKIITNGKVYVQKSDIAYLNSTNLANATAVVTKMFGPGYVIINDKNKNEFIEYNNPNAIAFFKDIEYILDYDEVKYLDEEELIKLYNNYVNKKNNIAKEYNNMSREEKLENKNLLDESKEIDHMLLSIKDYLLYKKGELILRLPIKDKNKKKIKTKNKE